MIRFVTAKGMKQLEALCVGAGVGYQEMMENAGRSAAELLMERWPAPGRRVLVLCGRGNNGGDGFVAARILAEAGAVVMVALVCGEPATPESKYAYSQMPRTVGVTEGIPFVSALCRECQLIVDSIFGTGFHGRIPEELRPLFAAVRRAREEGIPVASLDIPSGVEADSGRYECCIPADVTVALGALKPAHLVNWREEYTADTALGTIGIPREAEEAFEGWMECTDLSWFRENRPRRSHTGHKGNNGRLLLVAGSRRFPGAAALAAASALRSGVGYVHLASVPRVCKSVGFRSPEAIFTLCKKTPEGSISRESLPDLLKAAQGCDAIAAGCGMTACPDTLEVVRGLLGQEKPLLLDADALNVLAGHLELLRAASCPVLITPHPGEYARLSGLSATDVGNNPFSETYTMAKDTGITVLLKGYITGVSSPDGATRYHFGGCDGLAKGGSGDVLAGLVGGLLAQGLEPARAALCGAWLQGRAAQLCAAELSREAMLPSDLAGYLGRAFLEAE